MVRHGFDRDLFPLDCTQDRCPGLFSAVPNGTGPGGMYTQDCVLGYFQPSLAGLNRLSNLSQDYVLDYFSRPCGTVSQRKATRN
jgi:hypothetical protein